ncbi:hypothetical protein FF1_026863 [Malus domestica]
MNNLEAMVTAGSKGNFIKMSQMIACVGQQNIEGKRTLYGLINHPPLPHFTEDDYGPECRGEGLIDTAVKTYETGAFFGGHYGVVRNSLGDVIQFVYGEDGMDATWISELLESVAMLSKQKLKDRSQLGREIGGTNDMHPKEIVEAIDKLQIEFHFRQSLVEPRKWLD